MRYLGKNSTELVLYFIGAFIATTCNSIAQKVFLTSQCADSGSLCRMAAIASALVISFCIKFLWDSLLVFKSSSTSPIRKGFFFLLSSALITCAYLLIMFAIVAAGVSNVALIGMGWILFGLGYFAKYVLDKRFAFGTSKLRRGDNK